MNDPIADVRDLYGTKELARHKPACLRSYSVGLPWRRASKPFAPKIALIGDSC